MSDFAQIVKDALEYYDGNAYEFHETSRAFEYYSVTRSGIMSFYDINKKKVYEAPCEFIGKLSPMQGIWIWGWSLSWLPKERITTSRRVLNYAFDLDERHFLLKTALVTSRHQVTSNIQVDIHVALTSFLSKQPFVYRLDQFGSDTPDEKTIEYIDGVKVEMIKIFKKSKPISSYFFMLMKNTANNNISSQ